MLNTTSTYSNIVLLLVTVRKIWSWGYWYVFVMIVNKWRVLIFKNCAKLLKEQIVN